jgi:GNAT superfamily N-acetyltransferase
MSDIVYREYREEDQSALRALAAQLYRALLPSDFQTEDDDAGRAAHFTQIMQIKSGGGEIFVAGKEGELIGFVCITGLLAPQQQDAVDQPYAFLSDFFVVPRFQCRGIGAALMRRAEQFAYARGVRRVALKVLAENSHAIEFYQHHHYQSRFIVMAKRLEMTES